MQIKTRVDGQCVKEYLKKNIILFSIFLGVGALYGISYLMISIVKGYWNRSDVMISLVFSILIVIMASIFLFRVSRVVKITDKHAYDAVYDFSEEGIFREAYIEGEKKSESKISYSEIIHYKVSDHYIYLVLFNKTYFPVYKDEKLEELLIAKNIIRK